ncbi:adenylate/guanylate cyclase domain-containing protein [Saccharibacter floricola]|uniref:adenylate cyclase n=1 Tax=Saccharibacter floricola DSM 15669 TaxID=1123227 RepID=A0ABQ0NX24_9PROT|nr:adenylate/guanylate cyclase domain-containing protein [Saccharibacter floricola]GBQ04853.1 adenylate cyclase [Saccharibacter floricola DSM 15669]
MSSDEIVDPAASLANRRWQIFQFIAPILGVLLVIGTIALVTLHTYHTMREGAIVLSRNLLRTQQRYITQEVSDYLSPATSTSIVARDALNRPDVDQNAATFMSLGRAVLKNAPQVDSFFLGDEDGRVWMVSRHGDNYVELALKKKNGENLFENTTTDSHGKFLSVERYPAGDYDSRTRPWYTGGIRHEHQEGSNRLYWTDPYPYVSTHQFIVTASTSFHTLDGHRFVFAINVSLNQLTKFVNSLKVGKSGKAVIVDLDGHVIAGRNMEGLEKPGFNAADVHLDPVIQPVFVRALNIFRVRGDGAGLVHARGQNYVTIASAMPLAKRSWVLLLNAPENDFASFTQDVQKQTIYFSLLIVGLASLLALGLIYQGRRVERLQKVIRGRSDEEKRENAILLRVANTPGLLNPSQEIPILTEALAERSGGKRVSVWRLLSDKQRLICEDMFDAARNVHAAGIELNKSSYEKLFETLSEMYAVNVSDATQDERFEVFHRLVMRTANTQRLLFFPVTEQHRPVGALMIENAGHNEGIERIVALASSVLAVRFAQEQRVEKTAPSTGQDSYFERAVADHDEQIHYVHGFLVNPLDGTKAVPETGLYPAVPLMVLEFAGAYTAQQDAAKQMIQLIGDLSSRIQNIARETGLFAVQVSGSRVVFLGSCQQKLNHGDALRLADSAIRIREACLMALAGINTDLTFRIGFDVGPVMASHLGKDPDVFNIWGEGLNVAELLARNSPDDGQIQVSEQAYQELRSYFLFRPRGDFYLPGSGVTRSYILAGRR